MCIHACLYVYNVHVHIHVYMPTLKVYFMHYCSEDHVPLLTAEDAVEAAVQMIVRPKDKLREEIRAAKKRRKEEKHRCKEEKVRSKDKTLNPHHLRAKLEKLQTRPDKTGNKMECVLPPVTFEGPAATNEGMRKQKKYVGCVYTVLERGT